VAAFQGEAHGHAGQGVVQFASRPDGNPSSLYALKFFAAWRDFQEEVDVYRNSPLRSFMPSVLHTESNENCSIRDPFGGLIPPFIVMEKGESLQERARNRRVDVFTAAQVRLLRVLCGGLVGPQYAFDNRVSVPWLCASHNGNSKLDELCRSVLQLLTTCALWGVQHLHHPLISAVSRCRAA
jgi:hypothetical protein